MKLLYVTVLVVAALNAQADVTGSVVSPEGKAVAGARVTLHAVSPFVDQLQRFVDGVEEPVVAASESDAKGNFKLPVEARGNYVVHVAHSGFAPSALPATGVQDIGGILLRPAGTKRGRITANGKPLPGARVWLFDGAAGIRTKTDDHGNYSVPDPAVWQPAVRATHEGYALHREDASATGSLTLDIALEPGTILRGKVLDPAGKRGVKAALLVDGIAAGSSGEDGSFALKHVASNWQRVEAVAGNLLAQGARGTSGNLRLANGVTFRGTAVDAKSRLPLVGAIVTMTTDPAFRSIAGSAVTDAKGQFSLHVLPANYSLRIEHAGYSPLMKSQFAVTAASAPWRAHLVPNARFTGQIVSADDRQAVAAARARPLATSRNALYFDRSPAVSAMDGRYAVDVPQWILNFGDVEVEVSKRGYAVAKNGPHALTPGEETRVDVTLTRGMALEGRVVDASGEPVSGVTVAAVELVDKSPGHPWGIRWNDEPTTGADGSFTLQLRPGHYDVFFHHAGYAPKRLSAVDVTKPPAPLEVRLEPPASVSGRVVTSTGEPVADLRVHVSVDGPEVHTRTGTDGTFFLPGLPTGEFSISIASDDETVDESRMVKAPSENVTIELTPSVQVAGRVLTKDGSPVTDFTTSIAPPENDNSWWAPGVPQAFHDPEGRFLLERVAVRPSELTVRAPGFAHARMALQLENGKSLTGLEVKLDRAGTITGRVTDADGAPVVSARVMVPPPAGYSIAIAAGTDADGEYTLDAVPLGEATLRVVKPGYQPVNKSITIEPREMRIDVRLEPGKTLAGRVVTETGVPVSEAQVYAGTDAAGAEGASAVTDASGRFRLQGLSAGIYSLRVSKRSYLDTLVETVDIETSGDLTLTLRAGATVTGRIIGVDVATKEPRTLRVAVAGGGFQTSGTIDPNGTYRVEGAPLGKVGVRAFVAGRTSELAEIETSNGRTTTVDLEFKEHNTVRGRVTRNGVPLRGGLVAFRARAGLRFATNSTIGDDGSYEIVGVPSGEYNITVTNGSIGADYVVTRSVSQSQTLDLDMRPATISVRVIDDATGDPVRDAKLSLQSQDPGQTANRPNGVTGADGRVILENLSPGSYDVSVTREGFAAYFAPRTLTEGAIDPFDVRLSPSTGFKLTLIDARTGRAVSGAVTVRNGVDAIVYNDYSADPRPDGALLLPLAPGTYRINIFSSGLGNIYVNATSPGSQQVTLRPGGTLEFETSGLVPVRLRSSDGAIYHMSPNETRTIHPVLDGTFFTDVTPGAYVVEVVDANGSVTKSERVEIREGQTTKVRL